MWRQFLPPTALSIAGLVLLSSIARAEFVRDLRGWEHLSPAGQQGYVAGVLDQTGVASTMDDRQLLIRSATELCLGRAAATSRAIADGVSEAYRREPKLAKQPPFLVAWYVAARRCKADINAELARSGLEPLDVEAILSALKVDIARSH